MARIADADLDRAVVLVELERSQRLRGRGLSDRDELLEDLDVLLAAPAHGPRHAPLGPACKDRGQVACVRGLGADQRVPGGISDRPVEIDQASPDDAARENGPPERRAKLHKPMPWQRSV